MERRLYGHNVAEFPKLVLPLVANTMPAGPVLPHTEDLNEVNSARRLAA